MKHYHSIFLFLLVFLLPQKISAQSIALRSIENGYTLLSFPAASGDREIVSSTDLVTWKTTSLYIPENRSFDFPIGNRSENTIYYAVGRIFPPYGLDPSLLSVSGKIIKEGFGGAVYQFLSDGSGEIFFTSPIAPTLNWSFTWQESSSAGMTNVKLTTPDGATEHINLQDYLDETIIPEDLSSFTTFSDGSGGSASSYPGTYSYATETPVSVPGAPNSFTGTIWTFSDQTAEFTLSFATDRIVTGPSINDGTPAIYGYEYIITGSNTATLDLIESSNIRARFFLDFDSSGSFGGFNLMGGRSEIFGETFPFGDILLNP